MNSDLPVRKYLNVWIKKRKNRKDTAASRPTVSYTLQWCEHGVDRYMSLGPRATLAYAKEAARKKEAELNTFERQSNLDPLRWSAFRRKYFDTFYPGHDLLLKERREAQKRWGKSHASMRSERLAMDNFARLVNPGFLHEVTTADREQFLAARLAEVSSAASVDTDLRVLRAVFNVAEDWKHCPPGDNPFAGRGKATVGARRTRAKERAAEGGKKERHYTFDEVKAILALATREAADADDATRFAKRRLRTLVYFVAYTGCRINEAVHLAWVDIDFDKGVAWLYFKVENDLKTEGSQAPFGLPGRLIEVLRDWAADKTCDWVFPNERLKPWKSGGAKYRPFDQMKALGARAGVAGANFKRFRHALSTHGKQRFGMSREQVQAQLRHTTTETQESYTHDDLANLRDAMKGVDFEA